MWNIQINEKAPVVAKQEIEIDAPVETVWAILTSINDWTKWQSSVTRAHLNGSVGEGTGFVWKAGGFTFRSVIHTCQPCQFLGWTGKTIGVSAIHNWKFKQLGGSVLVIIEESLQGVLASLMTKNLQRSLDQGIRKSLEELKSASENYLVRL